MTKLLIVLEEVGAVIGRVVVNAPVASKYDLIASVEIAISRICGAPTPVVPLRVSETVLPAVGVTVFCAVFGGVWTKHVGHVATAQEREPFVCDCNTEPLTLGADVGRVYVIFVPPCAPACKIVVPVFPPPAEANCNCPVVFAGMPIVSSPLPVN